MPIDVKAVAQRLKCSPEVLFGRLYHDMGNRFRHVDGSTRTGLFELQVGNVRHCVNFPYSVVLLAEQESRNRREECALALSIVAVIVAIAAAVAQYAALK